MCGCVVWDHYLGIYISYSTVYVNVVCMYSSDMYTYLVLQKTHIYTYNTHNAHRHIYMCVYMWYLYIKLLSVLVLRVNR